MEGLDASEHYENQIHSEQSPSLLTIILDTNPAAWALLSESLSLAKAVADLLVFINAHLACQYTNKVAVIASHGDKAQFLFPTSADQKLPGRNDAGITTSDHDDRLSSNDHSHSSKHMKHGKATAQQNGTHASSSEGNKYRPFRLVEEEITRNLQALLSATKPDSISTQSSTMVAGALTLALSYINRESIIHNQSSTGAIPNLADPSSTQAVTTESSATGSKLTNALQSRILLITLSPSTDLAHQYIPIMNSIFACQRLNIPIDVLHLPLPYHKATPSNPLSGAGNIETAASDPTTTNNNSTVFLQQAADATHGIFIPAKLSFRSPTPDPNPNPSLLLTYLLTAFLPPPHTRTHLIAPTRVDVDFRAACFCHRNVISTGFVCSICLSIFCSVPEGGECLTCGTQLTLGDYGGAPVVVPKRKKKKRGRADGGNAVGTPIAA